MSRNTDKGSIVVNTKDAEDMLQDFTKEEAGEIFMALLAYANRGEEYETDDRSMRILFRTIQANINRNNQRYDEKCERNRQAIKKRWEKPEEDGEQAAPNTNTNVQHEYGRIQTNTNVQNEYGRIQTNKTNTYRDRDRDRDRDNNIAAPLPRERARETLETTETTEKAEKTTEKAQDSGEKVNCQRLCSQFNRAMRDARIPKIKRIAGQRREFLLARAREYGPVAVYRVILKAARSDFLNGGGDSGWVASFEWIFRPNNFPKVLDGYYDNQPPTTTTAIQTNGEFKHDTAETPAKGGWANSRSGQRAAEQRERIQGYASVAGKWRQIADSDAAKVANKGQPAANVPR